MSLNLSLPWVRTRAKKCTVHEGLAFQGFRIFSTATTVPVPFFVEGSPPFLCTYFEIPIEHSVRADVLTRKQAPSQR